MSVSKMQAEEPYCGPGFRAGAGPLLRGFMDGYRWQGEEDDYEVVHGGRARNEEGQQDNHCGEIGRAHV